MSIARKSRTGSSAFHTESVWIYAEYPVGIMETLDLPLKIEKQIQSRIILKKTIKNLPIPEKINFTGFFFSADFNFSILFLSIYSI